MAFKVGFFEDVTIIGITDPRLAAAVRTLGDIWAKVRDRPEASTIVDDAVRMTEELTEKATRLAAASHRP